VLEAPRQLVPREIALPDVGALGVDVTAYRAAIDLLVSERWPFADVPRHCAGFDNAETLLRTMAGEIAAEAPVHAVLVP
jgi:alcohol dehydrogenase